MSKFTAAQLVEFYQKVADGGVIEVSNMDGSWHTTTTLGPSLAGDNNVWRIKPAKKIIDMAHFIRSGIDCEFWHSKAYPNQSIISKLDPLTKIGDTWFYSKCKTPDGSTMNGQWKYCRPRMNHKMFHDGGECPIPSGFRGHVYLRDGQVGHHGETTLATWSHDNDSFDIIGYEILGLADGWAYPWESE